MVLQIRPALDRLRSVLIAAGFTGSHYDPHLVNPPGAVWIQPREVAALTLDGGGELTVWLYLLTAADDDTAATLSKLDDALEGLAALDLALSRDEPIDLAASVLLPDHEIPLPAYRIAVDLELGD